MNKNKTIVVIAALCLVLSVFAGCQYNKTGQAFTLPATTSIVVSSQVTPLELQHINYFAAQLGLGNPIYPGEVTGSEENLIIIGKFGPASDLLELGENAGITSWSGTPGIAEVKLVDIDNTHSRLFIIGADSDGVKNAAYAITDYINQNGGGETGQAEFVNLILESMPGGLIITGSTAGDITPAKNPDFVLALNKGWNFVSTPFELDSMEYNPIEVLKFNVYSGSSIVQTYYTTTKKCSNIVTRGSPTDNVVDCTFILKQTVGYGVWSEKAGAQIKLYKKINGANADLNNLKLSSGHNTIGAGSASVKVSDVKGNCINLAASSFDGTAWNEAATLEPGNAYDLKVTSSCVLGQPPAPPPDCVPKTCTEFGVICGDLSDGCGGTLSCGSCAEGTCSSGQCIAACTDSDVTLQFPDGKNYYMKGTTQGPPSGAGVQPETVTRIDECVPNDGTFATVVGGLMLKEQYCFSGKVTTAKQNCPNGCNTGACKCIVSTQCPTGQTCSNNACVAETQSCTDQCDGYVLGDKICDAANAGYKTCGDYNNDGCVEWSTTESCNAGETCSNGVCALQCSTDDWTTTPWIEQPPLSTHTGPIVIDGGPWAGIDTEEYTTTYLKTRTVTIKPGKDACETSHPELMSASSQQICTDIWTCDPWYPQSCAGSSQTTTQTRTCTYRGTCTGITLTYQVAAPEQIITCSPTLGTLTVYGDSGAALFIDEVTIGWLDSTGSITLEELKAGMHTLALDLSDYEPMDSALDVEITAGETTTKTIYLTPYISTVLDKVITEHNSDGFVIAIGSSASPSDNIGGIDVAAKTRITTTKLDTDYGGAWKDYNYITVGGPCANTATAEVFGEGTGESCENGYAQNQGKIQVTRDSQTGKTSMIVAGYSAMDTRNAARALATYTENIDSFKDHLVYVCSTKSNALNEYTLSFSPCAPAPPILIDPLQ